MPRYMSLSNPAGSAPTPVPAVLHVLIDGRDLLLWAEAAGPRPAAVHGWTWYGAPHPGALAASVLHRRLRSDTRKGPLAVVGTAASEQCYRQLPTRGGTPLPSPAAGGEPAAVGVWQTWSLPVLRLATRNALPLLLAPFPLPDSALRFGPEWAAVWRAAALVRGLVARGAVAPGLIGVSRKDRRAAWRPVWGRAERARLGRLAEVGVLAPEEGAAGTLEAFAWAYADALVRDAAARSRALAPYRRVPRDQRTPARLWLADSLASAPRRSQVAGAGLAIRRWMADPARVDGPGRLVLRLEPPAAAAGGPQGPLPHPSAAEGEAPQSPRALPSSATAQVDGRQGVLAHPAAGVAAQPPPPSLPPPPAGEVKGPQSPLPHPSSAVVQVDVPQSLPLPHPAAVAPGEGPQLRALPPAENAPWLLHIYLEPGGEPGALVPAGEVWSDPPGPGALLPGGPAALADALGQAAVAVPALQRALGRDVDQVDLTTAEAWDLLQHGQDRLRALGATVLVPAWWEARVPRGQLRLQPATSSGLFGADALVRFSWEVAIGDATISAEEFERLVALRVPLVRLGGDWVALRPGAAEALLSRWRAAGGPSGQVGAGAAMMMALQSEAEDGEPVLAHDAVRQMLEGLTTAPPEMPEPEGFSGTLRPYQRRGLGWLHSRARLGLGGILADDMGLGKTIQVLALLAARRAQRPTLIVSPTSVVANWAAEAARFTPTLRVLSHHGADRARGPALAATIVAAQIVLTSYPLLLRDADALAAIDWDGVILDEAQNVKNASAKQARAARRLRATYRFALTGTPVENALADLWSIFTFVQPGYLGSADTFRRRLAVPIERDRDPEAQRTLRRLVAPLLLRRQKSEPGIADELPPKTETLERCSLTAEQAALYQAVADELLQRVEETTGMQRKAAVLLTLLRLKQVCNHPAHHRDDGRDLAGRSGKLARLEELLDEVTAEGQRALVFTQFAQWGRRLQAHLAARLTCPVWRLDGATPAAMRGKLVATFQRGDGPGVFVLSLKAGGAGLNLTAATHVFHYDRWWNPAVERQATDRAYRIGQRHPVQVHTLMCVGTLEERIDELLRRKGVLADGVLGAGGEAWLTELGTDELREVLTLRRAALGE